MWQRERYLGKPNSHCRHNRPRSPIHQRGWHHTSVQFSVRFLSEHCVTGCQYPPSPPNYPPFLFSPSAAPPYAYVPPTIGLQTTLITGPLKKPWFPNAGDPHHSPPLSPIAGNLGAPGVTIPACCIFTFDGHSKIMQLAVYMDRYRLVALQPGGHAILAALGKATKEALELFENRASK